MQDKPIVDGDKALNGTGDPAADLQALTWEQILQIDAAVNELCAHGFGEITIVVAKGRPRFIRPSPSIELKDQVIRPAAGKTHGAAS